MAATFPGGVKSFTTKQTEDDIMASHVNDLQDEVVAIESELLTPSKFPVTPESAPTSDYEVANKKYVDGKIVFLTEPLTSTDWDGDSYSTIGKTKIDLNTVFGTPPNTKAVLVWYGVRDSASSTFDANLELSPNAVLPAGMSVGCSGLGNDKWSRGMVVVPCDEDGNVYYRITASGVNTMDVYLQIWGYWL